MNPLQWKMPWNLVDAEEVEDDEPPISGPSGGRKVFVGSEGPAGRKGKKNWKTKEKKKRKE